MINDNSGRMFYTNLKISNTNNTVQIKPENIIEKKILGVKKKRDGTEEEQFKLVFNKDYWIKQPKPLNILWDEIHLTANSRRSSSKYNEVISRFIAMGRRIAGFDRKGYGHLIFIAQNERTIDVNIRELANEIRFFRMNWQLGCLDCGRSLRVHSDMEEIEKCVFCNSWNLERKNFMVRVWKFNDWFKYLKFREGWRGKYHFATYYIHDIEDYFKYYDTHQMEDLWDDFVTS